MRFCLQNCNQWVRLPTFPPTVVAEAEVVEVLGREPSSSEFKSHESPQWASGAMVSASARHAEGYWFKSNDAHQSNGARGATVGVLPSHKGPTALIWTLAREARGRIATPLTSVRI